MTKMTYEDTPYYHNVRVNEGDNFGDVDEVDCPTDYNLVISEVDMTFSSGVIGACLSLTVRDTVANGGSGAIPLVAMDEGDVDAWNTASDQNVWFCGPNRFAVMADEIVELSPDNSAKVYKMVFKFPGESRIHLKDKVSQSVTNPPYHTVTTVSDYDGVAGYGDSDGGTAETAFEGGGSDYLDINWKGFKYYDKTAGSAYRVGKAR